MKYLITESKIENAIFKYLDKQDFVQIGYGENIYIVNSEKDEYAQIGYNVRNGWCVISYGLLEELISFFPLSYGDMMSIITKWFENKFNVETSMIHVQPDIVVYYF
jgi:hypothetical protein